MHESIMNVITAQHRLGKSPHCHTVGC